MVEVGGIVVPMAARALEHRVVGRICVAHRADASRIAVAGRERRRVSKGRSGPGRRVVASGAGGRGRRESGGGDQSSRNVVGHKPAQVLCAVPIRRMAAVAIDRRRCGTKRSKMAKVAGNRCVHASEGEAGCGVVKRCPEPGRCRVALIARRRVCRGNVIRNRSAQGLGAVVIRHVAT